MVRKPSIRTGIKSSKTTTGDKASYNRHEQNLANALPNARRQPQSGAMAHAKGDILVNGKTYEATDFMLDSKQSNGSTIIIAGLDLTKINREATQVGREPGMIITIDKVPPTTPKEWVLVPLEVFSELIVNQK